MMRTWIHRWLLTLLSAALLAPAARADDASSVARVWSLEDAYWRYVKDGDVEHYLTLWHPQFVGWPCSTLQPSRRSGIGDWVRRIHDEKIRLTYELTREAAEDFGDVVIVYYRTPMVYAYPDGHATGTDGMFKFTHTWRRTASGWQIIGGMCARLERIVG